ncbi:Hsp20/alpha crystallin family protein [Dactylosporangium salmoneum]|uniref:SHSP domain-containing protein n=1 Tax=Dactylosporangium salmoneum TaxID=53361 RepID=A0ABN3I7A4_9ACTN
MTLLVTHPRRSLGMPVTVGAPVDVEETGDAFRIELDLPGVAAHDVQIELRESEIRVFGTFGERRREGMLRHHARRTGEFEYLIALPGGVVAETVTADLDGGVLTIVAPKARGQQARRIELKPSGTKKSHARKPEATVTDATIPDDGNPGVVMPDNPAAAAKQMKEGQSRPGAAGPSGTGSTGQVGRSSMG